MKRHKIDIRVEETQEIKDIPEPKGLWYWIWPYKSKPKKTEELVFQIFIDDREVDIKKVMQTIVGGKGE